MALRHDESMDASTACVSGRTSKRARKRRPKRPRWKSALQTSAGLRPIATALTEDQVREAEALFQRMAGKARTLSFYVDFALEHYREPERQKSLTDAMSIIRRHYLDMKSHEEAERFFGISPSQAITAVQGKQKEPLSDASIAA